jgi:hypothetical protein
VKKYPEDLKLLKNKSTSAFYSNIVYSLESIVTLFMIKGPIKLKTTMFSLRHLFPKDWFIERSPIKKLPIIKG